MTAEMWYEHTLVYRDGDTVWRHILPDRNSQAVRIPGHETHAVEIKGPAHLPYWLGHDGKKLLKRPK